MNAFFAVDLIWLRICLLRRLVPVLAQLATDHPPGGEADCYQQYGKAPNKFTNKYLSFRQSKKQTLCSVKFYPTPPFPNFSEKRKGDHMEMNQIQIKKNQSSKRIKKPEGRRRLCGVISHRCRFNNGIQKGATLMRRRRCHHNARPLLECE